MSEIKCTVCGSEAKHILKGGAVELCQKHFDQKFGKYSHGAEEGSASVEDLIIQIDNGEDVFLNDLTKNQIDALSDHYSGSESEIRSCFTCSVLTDDWDLISEGYECGTCSKGNRTDYEDRKYGGHLGPFSSEEGDTPIQDPMELGEPANWTPVDGTPSLKKRKRSESGVFSAPMGYAPDGPKPFYGNRRKLIRDQWGNLRFIRRRKNGTYMDNVDFGRSIRADKQRQAKTWAPPGFRDQGDGTPNLLMRLMGAESSPDYDASAYDPLSESASPSGYDPVTFEAPKGKKTKAKKEMTYKQSHNSQVSTTIRTLMHDYDRTGKVGNSSPKNRGAALKQAIAIAYSKTNQTYKRSGKRLPSGVRRAEGENSDYDALAYNPLGESATPSGYDPESFDADFFGLVAPPMESKCDLCNNWRGEDYNKHVAYHCPATVSKRQELIKHYENFGLNA